MHFAKQIKGSSQGAESNAAKTQKRKGKHRVIARGTIDMRSEGAARIKERKGSPADIANTVPRIKPKVTLMSKTGIQIFGQKQR